MFRFQKLYRYSDLENEGLIEIEVFPPRRPEQKEISTAELERVIRPLASGAGQRRDILAIRSIDAGSIKKVYLRATALLFKSLDDGQLQLGFVLDGKLSQEHELTFTASEGYKRFIDRVYVGRDIEAEIEVQHGLQGKVVDESKSLSVSLSISEAEASIARAKGDLNNAGFDEMMQIRQRLEESELKLADLIEESRKQKVRNLYMLDHPPLLADSIKTTKARLMIISPWIYGVVVDEPFLKGLEALLKRNVRVFIGYGINEIETSLKKQVDVDARKKLRELADTYSNFILKRLGNTHAKVLIKDDEFAVITSFNWLSFRGDANRKLRDEQGVLYQDAEMVNHKFLELEPRFIP